MGLFSKKEEVPELPPAPTLPDVPNENKKKDLPELPSFPQSSRNENLNQEIVKSAVADEASPGEKEVSSFNEEPKQEFPVIPKKEEPAASLSQPGLLPPKTIEVNPKNSIPELPSTSLETKEEKPSLDLSDATPADTRPATRSNEPIFVRIDKFQSSQDSFDKILAKVKEIEKTIDKIKKVKSQEDEELAKWSSEVEQLKSRLSDIDDNIFSQV